MWNGGDEGRHISWTRLFYQPIRDHWTRDKDPDCFEFTTYNWSCSGDFAVGGTGQAMDCFPSSHRSPTGTAEKDDWSFFATSDPDVTCEGWDDQTSTSVDGSKDPSTHSSPDSHPASWTDVEPPDGRIYHRLPTSLIHCRPPLIQPTEGCRLAVLPRDRWRTLEAEGSYQSGGRN